MCYPVRVAALLGDERANDFTVEHREEGWGATTPSLQEAIDYALGASQWSLDHIDIRGPHGGLLYTLVGGELA